jgi:tRNA nucleotidyltransferase (CCA-adding enzyme)
MIKKGWEHYSHTADMGIRGFGATKEDAFAEAALAMIGTSIDLQTIRCSRQVEIACEGDDDELLFIAWLNCILYEMAVRKMVFGRFEVAISGKRLTGRIWGEKLDSERHKPVMEIKGATYSDLKVRQDKDGTWIAQCIIDI